MSVCELKFYDNFSREERVCCVNSLDVDAYGCVAGGCCGPCNEDDKCLSGIEYTAQGCTQILTVPPSASTSKRSVCELRREGGCAPLLHVCTHPRSSRLPLRQKVVCFVCVHSLSLRLLHRIADVQAEQQSVERALLTVRPHPRCTDVHMHVQIDAFSDAFSDVDSMRTSTTTTTPAPTTCVTNIETLIDSKTREDLDPSITLSAPTCGYSVLGLLPVLG